MKTRLNILIVSSTKAFGGMENQTVNLVRALSARGHSVVLGAPAGSLVYEKARQSGVQVEDISFANAGDLLAVFKMAKAVRRHKTDFIVATMGKEYWPVALGAKKILGRKVIFMRHMADRLKGHTAWLVRHVVDKVVAVSGFVRQGLMEAGIPPEKISVVYNGIDTDRFFLTGQERQKARAEFHFSPEDVVVGSAGALNEGKGLFVLLKAAGKLKKTRPGMNVKLLMVGEGPGREELQAEAARLGVTAVFPGRRLDMQRMYGAMDIFTFPSVCRETFGMVVIEAMAAGLPVVASRVGGVPEVVKDGENGLLVPPGDPQALALAITRLVQDTGLSERLAQNGRKTVEGSFSSGAMAESFESALLGL